MNKMSNSYLKLKQFMKKYPMTVAWRVKKHANIIDKHLNPGEDILYAFTAQKNDRAGDIFNTYAIVFTNKRIMLGRKRTIFGYFFKSVTPDMYNDLTVNKGLIWGRVEIDTVKEKIILTNIDCKALPEIETNITEIMIKNKKEYIKSNEKDK